MAMVVYTYKNTGLRYLVGSDRILFAELNKNNGVLITKQEFADWDERGVLFQQVLGLKNEKSRINWDFEATAETSTLTRIGSPRKPPKEVMDEAPALPAAAEPAAPPPLKNPDHRPVGEQHQSSVHPPLHDGHMSELTQEQKEEFVRQNIDSMNKMMDQWLHPAPGPDGIVGLQQARDAAVNYLEATEPYWPPVLQTMTDQQRIAWAIEAMHKDGTNFPVEQPVKEQKKKVSLVGIHTSRNVMIWVMLIVGGISLLMSGYHITRYLWEARGGFVAIATGVAMGLFSAAAFTTGRYFWFLKTAKDRLIGGTFWTFGLAAVIFAMFATMTVNYDDFKTMTDAKIKTAVSDSTTVKTANTQDANVQKEYDRLTDEMKQADADEQPFKDTVNRYNKLLTDPTLTDVVRQQYVDARDSAQYSVNVNETKVKPDRERLRQIGDKLLGVGTQAVQAEDKIVKAQEKGTLFSMLHDIFGWEIDTMKLIVYVIPAIFYDIMSPFALTVVMILEEKREEEENADAS
jgi:hypothetical protein